jgi:hypothetical protein
VTAAAWTVSTVAAITAVGFLFQRGNCDPTGHMWICALLSPMGRIRAASNALLGRMITTMTRPHHVRSAQPTHTALSGVLLSVLLVSTVSSPKKGRL